MSKERSDLSPSFRKGGWYARGSIPVRGPDGTVRRRRVERSAGADCKSERQCKAFCDRLNAQIEERLKTVRKSRSFAKAMDLYLAAGKPKPKFAVRLAQHLGLYECVDIDQAVLADAAAEIFPEDAKPGYVNRHLFTPVNAILTMAARDKVCDKPAFVRPKGYADHPDPVAPKSDEWFRTVVPQLRPHAAALAMILTVHGRRIGELLKVTPAGYDAERGVMNLGKTKNGKPIMLTLHPALNQLVLQIPDWQSSERIFQYVAGTNGVTAFNKHVKEVCKRLGVEHFTSHQLGRHRFAIRMLDTGLSTQVVKDAGGWSSMAVFSSRYGARASSELTPIVHRVGNEVIDLMGSGGNTGESLPADPCVSRYIP